MMNDFISLLPWTLMILSIPTICCWVWSPYSHVTCVTGVKRGRGRRNLGARERVGHSPPPSSLLPRASSRALIPFPFLFERLPRRLTHIFLYCSFIGEPGGQKGRVRFPWDTRTTGKCVYQEKWTRWTEGKNTGGYFRTGREGMDGISCTIIASYAGEWTKEYKLTGFSSDGEGFHGRVFGKCHKCE